MWYLLAVSLGLLAYKRKIAYVFLFSASIIGWANNVLEIPAVILICLLPVIWYVMQILQQKHNYLRIVIEGVCVVLACGLMMHLLPGFNNVKILDAVNVGSLSAPFSMYYNFDKALIPYFLFACMGTLFVTEPSCKSGGANWLVLILTVPSLLLVAVALGGLRIEPHLPEWLPQFALANIFFVSLAEEALFRGYLQQRLTKLLHPVAALLVTSAVFGAMHYSGGILMIIFAALAGIIYGLAWMWSGKLWIAVLFHFGLNYLHLLFFTYPVYSPNSGM